jgi:hypothetical protein
MPIVSGPITELGAVVDLLVGVHGPRREVLERNKLPVPGRHRLRAQIDTGTTFTAVDAQVLRSLNLPVIDRVSVRTSSTTGEPQVFNQYAVSLGIEADGIELHLPQILVLECAFAPEDGILALIGQDVLKHCLFLENGPAGAFSLAY